MSTITDNLITLRRRIANACRACDRDPRDVRLLAITKGQSATAVAQAIAAGQREFGENYLQEALAKRASLAPNDTVWHYTGAIQSNKTREISAHFDWVQTVDRLPIAQRLSAQRPDTLPPLNVCVQVNISAEASKSGCAPESALELCSAVAALPHLTLRGLMAIPAPGSGRIAFAQLRALYESTRESGLALDTLSAGMSDDLELAIAEGATLVRVGAAIFGAREVAEVTLRP